MSLADSSFSTLLVWFTAFALSALCLLISCLELFSTKTPRSFWVQCGIRGCLFGLVAFIAADFMGRLPTLAEGLNLLIRTALLSLTLLVGYVLLFWRNYGMSKVGRLPWSLVAGAVAAVLWTSVRFYVVSSPVEHQMDKFSMASIEDQMTPSSHLIAYTDQGRAITLYEYDETVDQKLSTSQFPDVFSDFVIVQSQPSSVSNCHGWIFSQGTHLVLGRTVDKILDDNGYATVSEPQVGDIIVHRDSDGVPSHTGLVKAIGADGFVLIESKWGLLGRYLHEPTQQCYSQDFAYYRSPREGHTLRIEEVEIPGATPADPSDPSRIVKSNPGSAPALGNQHPLGAE